MHDSRRTGGKSEADLALAWMTARPIGQMNRPDKTEDPHERRQTSRMEQSARCQPVSDGLAACGGHRARLVVPSPCSTEESGEIGHEFYRIPDSHRRHKPLLTGPITIGVKGGTFQHSRWAAPAEGGI
jgi:hypothetical protein